MKYFLVMNRFKYHEFWILPMRIIFESEDPEELAEAAFSTLLNENENSEGEEYDEPYLLDLTTLLDQPKAIIVTQNFLESMDVAHLIVLSVMRTGSRALQLRMDQSPRQSNIADFF